MDIDGLRRARTPAALLLAMAGALIVSYGYGPAERALPVLVAWTTIALLVLEVLVQDGYFTRQGEEFRFASGLLEDWQRSRKGLPINPLTAI